MDEELLYQSLKRLESQGDRSAFREMAKVFGEVIRYSQDKGKQLEEKIDREWKDPLEKRYIFGTVAAKGDAALADHVFFPMAEEPERLENLLGTLFIQLGEPELSALLTETRQGLAVTEEGEYQVEVRLERADRYREALERLHYDFYYNRIFTGNMNLPYIDKFFDVYLQETEQPYRGQDILDLKLDGLEEIGVFGVIPLWNVKKRTLPCAIFPVPASDTCYFEHELVLPDAADGYVVSADLEAHSIFYRDNSILLWSKRELAKKWEVSQIISMEGKEIAIPHWAVTTNHRIMTHSDRQAETTIRLPRTKGEMMRVLNSYELVSGLKVEGEIESGGSFTEGRKMITISFRAAENSFIARDEMNFLLKELSGYFPEYMFKGELC